MPQIFALINSGFNVSGDIDLRKHALVSIRVPTITSGDLAVQGNIDSTSAGYLRLLETRVPGSGSLRFAAGPGSCQIQWPRSIETPAFARLETLGSAMTNPATLTLLVQARHLQ